MPQLACPQERQNVLEALGTPVEEQTVLARALLGQQPTQPPAAQQCGPQTRELRASNVQYDDIVSVGCESSLLGEFGERDGRVSRDAQRGEVLHSKTEELRPLCEFEKGCES